MRRIVGVTDESGTGNAPIIPCRMGDGRGFARLRIEQDEVGATPGGDTTPEIMSAPVDDGAVSQIVVIGSSAGGVNALSVLVSALPAEFPAPIVIAQHLDPSRPSHLEEIFAARSTLPVRTVSDTEPLAPGTIFVVPAGRHVEIADHQVRVASGDGIPRPSIDRLLESAARSFGDDLIAIILSGFGADGAIGAQIVKALGGTVIVENPATAEYPSMPGSVLPPSVDIVADLAEIGLLLVDLVSGRYALKESEDDDDLSTLLSRVRERSGLDFGAYKRPTVERRLQRRMAAVGMSTVADYRRYLEGIPGPDFRDRHRDGSDRLRAARDLPGRGPGEHAARPASTPFHALRRPL
jgi:hypothetical protein